MGDWLWHWPCCEGAVISLGLVQQALWKSALVASRASQGKADPSSMNLPETEQVRHQKHHLQEESNGGNCLL